MWKLYFQELAALAAQRFQIGNMLKSLRGSRWQLLFSFHRPLAGEMVAAPALPTCTPAAGQAKKRRHSREGGNPSRVVQVPG
jgi:hypothetical protein